MLRKLVEFLGEHPILRKIFFFLGFFSVRFVYPVQYLVLRELMDCESILDLGCGRHSMVPILPKKIHTLGVELYKPHYEEAVAKRRHSEYLCEDITKVDFPDNSFDAVVMLDVIEHLPKEKGIELIQKMERWAKKKVVIFTPNGYLHQDEYDENPLMAHQSGWTAGEFSKRGFKVYGVRAFKSLKKDHYDDSERIDTMADLTQVITYHWPSTAFQLFCVKSVVKRS